MGYLLARAGEVAGVYKGNDSVDLSVQLDVLPWAQKEAASLGRWEKVPAKTFFLRSRKRAPSERKSQSEERAIHIRESLATTTKPNHAGEPTSLGFTGGIE
jgi:hypothetical protein